MTRPEDPARPDETLGAWHRTTEPPAALEDRVVRSLERAGLLGQAGQDDRSTRRGWVGGLVGLAAGLLGGVAIGRRGRGTSAASPPGPYWLLLLIEGEGFRPPSRGEEAARVEEYAAWAAGQRQRMRLVAGAELAPDIAVVDGSSQDTIAPGAVDGGSVGGYFIVAAADMAAARAIAADCPHVRHGGRIAVRPIIGRPA